MAFIGNWHDIQLPVTRNVKPDME